MKKILTSTLAIAFTAILFTSCSKETKLTNRLEGTWNIDKLDFTITPSGGGSALPFSFLNAGTFTFKSDKTGSYSITASVPPNNGTITWSNTATTVTINESGEPTKIYTVTTNEKTKQVWTTNYLDQGNQVSEILSLTKK